MTSDSGPKNLGDRFPEGPAVPGIDDLDVGRPIIHGDPPAVGRDGQGRRVAFPRAPLAVIGEPSRPRLTIGRAVPRPDVRS